MPLIDATPLPASGSIVAGVTTGHNTHQPRMHDEFNAERFANTVNVMHLDYGAVDGGSAATNTTALNAARAALVATGKPGTIIIPLGVDLPVTPDGVLGASNVFYGGGGKVSTTQTTAGALITFPAGSTNCGVDGLVFEAPNDLITAVYIKSASSSMSSGVKVSNNRCIECTLVDTNDLTLTYAGVSTHATTGNVTRHVRIEGNSGLRSAAPTGTKAFMFLYYTRGGSIGGNVSTGYASHIQWWGGDANPAVDGALANERKCGGFTISGDRAYNVLIGGIWGSMGRDIESHGHVDTSGDVGHDSEGGQNVRMSGTARNCTNGGVAVFSFNRSALMDVDVETDTLDGSLANINNVSLSQENRDVTLRGTYTCNSGIGSVVCGVTSALRVEITLVNALLYTAINNQGDTTLRTHSLFTTAAGAAFNAVEVGQTHNRVLDVRSSIYSNVVQPAGSRAIKAHQITSSTSYLNVHSRGFGTTPWTIEHGPTSSALPTTWVSGHMWDGTSVERIESGSGGNNGLMWILPGELTNALGAPSIPSAVPVAGRWDRGQRIFYPTPSAAGKIGAVCVATGSPGTWKDFGAIDA